MYSKVYSGTWEGIDGVLIEAEADISNGLPVFEMIGYLSSEVREAKERVRTALKNQGFLLPPKRITVNLAPANLRKSGTMYDLAISISVLIAGGFIDSLSEPVLFLGEVGLDGSVNKVQGVLPVILRAREQGIRICIVPEQNRKEGSIAKDITCIGVASIAEVVHILEKWKDDIDYSAMRLYYKDKYEDLHNLDKKMEKKEDIDVAVCSEYMPSIHKGMYSEKYSFDFSDIKGQSMAKRALEIAVSGHHNLIMSGSPGSGKSALAKRIPMIMPELTYEEQLEITRIYSVSGKIEETGELLKHRPYRAPHHSITTAALIGGGKNADPGEISLAHKGVLFLDELPEFKRDILDMMRQPLEDQQITVSRNRRVCLYPADFMLVAAMNPCPCGYYPDRKKCSCTPSAIRKYQNRISGPMLDRIDMLVSVKPVSLKRMKSEKAEETSEQIKKRVERTRQIQRNRYKNESFKVNAHLTEKALDQYCHLSEKNQMYLEHMMDVNEISYRGYVRILKLARTIADMEMVEQIEERHLTEAMLLRMGLTSE